MSLCETIERAARGAKIAAEAASIPVGLTPRRPIWTIGRTVLYRYAPAAAPEQRQRVPLLLVYALINKPYIFDLLPGRSFVEYMLGRGFDVYLLDWGAPGPEDRATRFDTYAAEYLPRAVRRVLATAGADNLHMLGYCIGGTLAVLYAALLPEAPLRTLALLAPPIDFAAGPASVYAKWLDARHFDVDNLVDKLGNIPPELIEFGSKMLKPGENYVGVYTGLWDRMDDPAAVEGWQAMHRWVHDGVPFAGAAFRQWVNDFIRANRLVQGELRAAGRRADLANIRTPLLNVVAQHDHIVPPAQSAALMPLVSSADQQLLAIPSGHVGLMGGSGARNRVWPAIADWLEARSLKPGLLCFALRAKHSTKCYFSLFDFPRFARKDKQRSV
jgi:polyhydroxyalkanoate synthase